MFQWQVSKYYAKQKYENYIIILYKRYNIEFKFYFHFDLMPQLLNFAMILDENLDDNIFTLTFQFHQTQFQYIITASIQDQVVSYTSFSEFILKHEFQHIFLLVDIISVKQLSLLQIFLWQHRQNLFFTNNISVIVKQNVSFNNVCTFWRHISTLSVQMGFQVLSHLITDSTGQQEIMLLDYKKYLQLQVGQEAKQQKPRRYHDVVVFSNQPIFDTFHIDTDLYIKKLQFNLTLEQYQDKHISSILLQRLALNMSKNIYFAHFLPMQFGWNAYQLIVDENQEVQSITSIKQEISSSQKLYEFGLIKQVHVDFRNIFCLPTHLLELEWFNHSNHFIFQQMCDISYLFKIEFFAAYTFCFNFDKSVLSQCSRSGKSVTLHSTYYFHMLVHDKIPIYVNLGFKETKDDIQLLYNKTSIDMVFKLQDLFNVDQVRITKQQQKTTESLQKFIQKGVQQYFNTRLYFKDQLVLKVQEFYQYQKVFHHFKFLLSSFIPSYFNQGQVINQVNVNDTIQKLLTLDMFKLSNNTNLQTSNQYQTLNHTRNENIILLIDECLQPQKNKYISQINFVYKLTCFYFDQIEKNCMSKWEVLKDYLFKKEKIQKSVKTFIISVLPYNNFQDLQLQELSNPLYINHQQKIEALKEDQIILQNVQSQINNLCGQDEQTYLHIICKDNDSKYNLGKQLQLLSNPLTIEEVKQRKQLLEQVQLSLPDNVKKIKKLLEQKSQIERQLKLQQNAISLLQDQLNLVIKEKNFEQELGKLNIDQQVQLVLLLYSNTLVFKEVFTTQPDIFDQISILSPNFINLKDPTSNFNYFQQQLEGIQFNNSRFVFKNKLFHYILSFYNPRCIETIFWRNIDTKINWHEHLQSKANTFNTNLLKFNSFFGYSILSKIFDASISKFNSLFGLSILSHENNYSNIQLLTAGTDMSIINFIRQQQTIYQASNSSTGLLYTLCNLIGGAQLHPTIITSKFYKNISINNQSNQQMMMQIDTYEIYFNLLNIYCSVLPELQGEVQFLCPLISPQLIFQYGEQNDNYCFNYAKQFNYLLNSQQMSQFQLQNYQQLFNGMKIQKQSQDIDQQISLSQQILIENQVQYKLLLSSDLNQFYKKLKVLSSTYINRDVFAILGYNITKWFFKQISKLISIENQIDLLNVFLKPQQISEITSCFLFFSNLTKNKLDEMTNFLNQLNYNNQYLSFFTQKGYNDQVGTWDQLQKQAENCEFILQNQSFDTFVTQKGNKADFIKHSLKGAAYTYHRLSELLPEKIKKMAIMVKIDFPHVSNYLLTADISLPDYVLFLFGFQSDFNSQFFSEVNYLYEKQLFTSYICGFESGNHTPQKLFQKINGSLLDTVIQCSVTNSINNDQDTNLYISLYEQTSFMLEQQQQNVIQNQQQEKVHDAIKKETQQYKQINNYPYLFQLPITENCPKNDLNDNLNNINNYNKSEQFNYLKQFIDNYCSQKSILSASFGYGHDLLQNIFKYDLAIKKCIKNEIGDCQYDYQKDSNLTPLEYYVVELLHILVD